MRTPRVGPERPLAIRLICLQKAVWGLALVILAITLVSFRMAHQTQPFQQLFADELEEDPHDRIATAIIMLVPAVSLRTELLLGAGALVYAALEGIEAWGLWADVLWVELLVVAETTALLPYEGWELTRHFTPLKLLSLVLNALVVWYLVSRYRRKRRGRVIRVDVPEDATESP